jgi:hypothetical protein
MTNEPVKMPSLQELKDQVYERAAGQLEGIRPKSEELRWTDEQLDQLAAQRHVCAYRELNGSLDASIVDGQMHSVLTRNFVCACGKVRVVTVPAMSRVLTDQP